MNTKRHLTRAELFRGGPVEVVLAGVGGSGSQMLTGLARLDHAMRALGHPHGLHVTVFDPDLVSESNVGRQLYYPCDIGLPKAVVAVHRINAAFGLAWDARTVRYQGTTRGDWSGSFAFPAILVTCVDSAKARREIHTGIWGAGGGTPYYWLDLGNRQVDGQVILGQPIAFEKDAKGKPHADLPERLRCVTEVFPELLDKRRKEDNTPSCSLAEALESQDLFINQAVVTWGLQLLWGLFRDGGIDHQGYFINLRDGRVNPLPVRTAALEVAA